MFVEDFQAFATTAADIKEDMARILQENCAVKIKQLSIIVISQLQVGAVLPEKQIIFRLVVDIYVRVGR
jgi:hypothetical protein